MDIEACIDNPVLAPLGRHVNKRRGVKRVDKDHIDINVVRPTSTATFIQEQEKESHAPVTSLILRRRRLDCEQLTTYLKNLQPALDPLTMSILRTPLLHLTELDLSRNRLSSLPDDMTSLVPFLSYLNLSHNQFREVPLELCRLTQLQVLIMSQNHLEGPFPHQVCSSLTQLKTLRLCANQITSLPHTLARLDKLESLSMGSVYGGNLLTSFPPHCIQHMAALRELDLSHNKLCFLPSDIGHSHSHLRQLVASDNKLEAIPKSIGMCRELRNLNLGRNQLTSLPTEIADLKQLDTLDLSENLLCVIPGDVADFLTKTTLLLTGNPFTRGHCDASRNPVSAIGGLGINNPSDEERYAAVLKSLSRRAILNSAASSSSSHTATLASLATGRESPRPGSSASVREGGESYEMDQDERLDYHLYYTRHALSSRPPSRAESINSIYDGSDNGSWADLYGTGTSTPRVNAEAVISDIDSYFDFVPSMPSPITSSVATVINASQSSTLALSEPPLLGEPALMIPSASSSSSPSIPSPQTTGQDNNQPNLSISTLTQNQDLTSSPSSLFAPSVPATPATSGISTSVPNFFPSLRELAARTVLYNGEPLPLEYIPEQVVDYLQPGARPCAFCRMPYVKEWVSSVRVKSYLGHPAVARRVRFCSSNCFKQASEQLEAEESGAAAGPAPIVTSGWDLVGGVRGLDIKRPAGSKAGSSMSMDSLENSSFDLDMLSPPSADTNQGMRVCKGGQNYWPVTVREKRASRRNEPVSKSSVARTSVCSGGCLGGGVCEW
ncbi:Podocan-like protein 1 [Podila epicladia]|nr:Podocan-like protein 1 [Podila epicladia]KAG0097414.1 Podocan-like protein 1 [Podila epicladia]